MCFYSREVIPVSWCPHTSYICQILPNHSSAALLQRCAISLSLFTLHRTWQDLAGAPHSPAHGLNAAARRLVCSRDLQEKQDQLPCADSERPQLRWRPHQLRVPHPHSHWQLVLGVWLGGLRRWRLSVRALVWLFGWMLRRRLSGGCLILRATLKTSLVQSRFCKSTTMLIAVVAWTHLREMRDNSVSREHLYNLSTFPLHSMIAVSA